MKATGAKTPKKHINCWCKGHFRSTGAKQFFKSKTDWVAPSGQLCFTQKALSTFVPCTIWIIDTCKEAGFAYKETYFFENINEHLDKIEQKV